MKRTPAGAYIVHEAPVPHDARVVPSVWGREVEEQLVEVYGKPTVLFEDDHPQRVAVRIHAVPPNDALPFWTLFTTGMSDLPMAVWPGFESWRFAELVLKLPADWPVERLHAAPSASELRPWSWPIEQLRFLARFPHDRDTWLGSGHTVPNGDRPRAFAAGTAMCAWVLFPPLGTDEPSFVRLSDGAEIRLWVLHGLHRDELGLKLKRGDDALLAAFAAAGVNEILSPGRRSVVPRRFGFLHR